MHAPRNRYARHPLMRKGGAHERSRGGQRVRDRQLLRDEQDACVGPEEDDKSPDGPSVQRRSK